MKFSIFKPKKEQRDGAFFDSLLYNSGGGYRANKAMLLSAVYRCVDVISDAVAQLPLEPYYIDGSGFKTKFVAHPTYTLLSKEPNKVMDRFTFMKVLVVSTLLKGNGYAYIKRDKQGNAQGIYFLDPQFVTVIDPTRIDEEVRYSYSGIQGIIEACNMIHVMNFTYDGIHGISTLAHARNTIGLAMDSESHASGFFKGGANLAGILKVMSPLNNKQKVDLKASWQKAFSPNTGNPNGVAILEGNMEFQPITVNPADAQLLETRQFNVVDICRFFGVSPVKAFDLTHASYNSVEAMQLAFLTDTLQPLLEKIECELERKLYKPSERASVEVRFDTEALLRTDKSSLADYYTKLFYLGVYSPNEIRKGLDMTAIEGGDNHFLQVNLQTMNQTINPQTNDTASAEINK